MRKVSFLACLAVVLLGTTLMNGQATRTWVSGVGDDANPCSRTAPCKTFAGAISKTAPGGEIDALDPGGFGALTITKSITLDGGGGQVASVLVAGTNGIVVAAGAADVVIIRNMRLDGLLGAGNANAGINGISFISGKSLTIENCVIFGFNNNGINIGKNDGGSVTVINTTSENNGAAGLRADNTTNTVSVNIIGSTFSGNSNGVWAGNLTKYTVTRSAVVSNTGAGFIAFPTTGTATMDIADSIAGNNAVGIQSGGPGGTGSTVRFAQTSLFENAVSYVPGPGGTIVNFTGTNYNANGGTPGGTPIAPQ